MILQYFVTETATERKIPIEIDRATDADLAGTKSCWQTDWTSEFIGDPDLEKYAAKTEDGEIVALGAYRETPESMFVYIEYIESHPDSNPTLVSHRKYVDIGRMMIAFGIQLSIDGQAVSRMRNGERLTVTRSPHDAQLVRFPRERNFFSLLKDKLSQWSL